jgi:hypothetical protein
MQVRRSYCPITDGGNSQESKNKNSFANTITVIRLHLMYYVELLAFIKDTSKAWQRYYAPANLFSG